MKKQLICICFWLFVSCVDDGHHEDIDVTIQNPDLRGKTEITFQQLYNLHNNKIGKDTLVSGYVISSDTEGNFFKEIYIQNTAETKDFGKENPRMGLRIRVGTTSTSTQYAKGRKIYINLEGLKKTTSNQFLTVGKPNATFIKDILEFELDTHLLKTNEVKEIIPKVTTIKDLTTMDLNTWVRIEGLHFKSKELGLPFADLPTDDFDGNRTLEICEMFRKDSIVLETSNFSDFASKIIPDSQLSIEALYTLNFDKKSVLRLNTFTDLSLTGSSQECTVRNPNILITEVADPQNASFSRFVELYNSESVEVSLKGWTLKRYNNGGSELSIALDDLVMEANRFLIIANAKVSTEINLNFKDSFGLEPSLSSSKLDGNGNDAYALYNEKNELVDVFGEMNADGLDKEWEYTNGRAYRNFSVVKSNSIFNIEEWTVVTENQNAPDDFTPYERKENELPKVVETAPLLITEVADPKEQANARFVEIYNPTQKEVSLNDWLLLRYNYTNSKNTKELAQISITLNGLRVPAKGFVIVAKDEVVFQDYFGITPDLGSSELDGNGDDAYELIDPFGTVVDVFGDVNIDGTSTVWEYTDGLGNRKLDIKHPNSVFDVFEWEVEKKKEGGEENFSPKVR